MRKIQTFAFTALAVLLLGCSSGEVTGEPLEPLSPSPMAVRTAASVVEDR